MIALYCRRDILNNSKYKKENFDFFIQHSLDSDKYISFNFSKSSENKYPPYFKFGSKWFCLYFLSKQKIIIKFL